ncbi:MAG TPA: ribulose-phosphate 3-epimerase [Candidatus Eisenbacteria bacterium]|nr:ribulose-phosphate 3-epimerase [Candidatus Eisenbacteria bacterium]
MSAAATWAKPPEMRLCPSILSADFARLGEQIALVQRAGADFLHVDVMDAQFVPNLTFGPIIVEACRKLTSLPLDVHLMVVEPLRFLEGFARAGADHLTVHLEAVADPVAAARAIRDRGLRAGIAIKPGTPIERILPVLEEIDLALVMTVEPGAGGQAYLPDSNARIARVRAAIAAGDLDCLLQIDGGVSPTTIAAAAHAGADTFVAGNSVFRAPDPANALRELREALRAAPDRAPRA